MGAFPTRCSLKLLVPAMLLAALAASPTYKLGTPLSQAEVYGFDIVCAAWGRRRCVMLALLFWSARQLEPESEASVT